MADIVRIGIAKAFTEWNHSLGISMTDDTQIYIPEDAIRLRSYLIWQREGCRSGAELDNWLRAKAQLEKERRTDADTPHRVGLPVRKPFAFVVPRIPVSTPPCRSVSARMVLEPRAQASVARQ